MKVEFLPSELLYQFEGSQAADQWLKGVDVDAFAIFDPEVGQLGIQIEEEQLVPYHLNCPLLEQLRLLIGTSPVRSLTCEC